MRGIPCPCANLNDLNSAGQGKIGQIPGRGPRLHPSLEGVRIHSLSAQIGGRELARLARFTHHDHGPSDGKVGQIPGRGPRLHASLEGVRIHSLSAQIGGRELARPARFTYHDHRPSDRKVQRLEGSIVAGLDGMVRIHPEAPRDGPFRARVRGPNIQHHQRSLPFQLIPQDLHIHVRFLQSGHPG